jgi:hypothetical protein
MSRQKVLVVCPNALLGILKEEGKYSGIFSQLQVIIGQMIRREGSMFTVLEACNSYMEGIFGFIIFF